tara:strand:+ start:677 stop:877 length:201 start_codon:yes stop_codon:yes gene_type:complete
MTNIYDVISQMHVKASAGVEKSAQKDLDKEDPPAEEARAILEEYATKEVETEPESGDESTEGDERE